MKELVFKSKEGTAVTTSRMVAVKFKKEHKDVLRAIDNLECSAVFKERNFAPLISSELHPSPIITAREYLITWDGFTFLAMGFTGKNAAVFKEDYINAFNDFRNQLTAAKNKIPESFSAALQLAADQAKQLEIQAPKVEGFDTFIDSKSLQSFKAVANVLGYGRNTLMAKLRKLRVLTSGNIPYQRYLNRDYFEVKESSQNGFNVPVTYVTPKGIDYIRKKLK